MYEIYSKIEYEKQLTLNQGQKTDFYFNDMLDLNNNYILNVVGEVAIDYTNRYEGILPIYYRKIDDSVCFNEGQKLLSFNKRNQTKERILHAIVKDGLNGKQFNLSIKSKINGLTNKFTVTAYVYYGTKNSRYYYENADEEICIELQNSINYQEYAANFKVDKEISFIMIKIEAIDFEGEAEIFAPKLINEQGQNICPDFDYCPKDIKNFKWVGEGFSYFEKPEYSIFVNGKQVFDGVIMDRLERFAGFKILVPSDLLNKKGNTFTVFYKNNNKIPYTVKEVRLLTAPKDFKLLGVKGTIRLHHEFGVFAYSTNDNICVKSNEYYDYLGFNRVSENYGILKFYAKKTGQNIPIIAKANDLISKINIDTIIDMEDTDIITGTGDFIYVAQDVDEFAEYLTWYLNEDIGDLLTFRCVYHWCGTEQINYSFWEIAEKLLSGLKIYFSMMRDGRELNGLNTTPEDGFFKTKYYLGSQTHERDGAFTYWDQNVKDSDELYYHVLSRKIKFNGIYGKRSPIYSKNGVPYLYYAPDKAKNVKEAYEDFKENIRLTGVDGAKRHTGVTTFFRTFYEAGYNWVGYEAMYGPHEVMLGVLRGATKTFDKENFGTHLALQWSTVPTDDEKHYIRYGLSLYLSYMHGAKEINTEEGLWRIENTYSDFDRYSKACIGHVAWQKKFNKFINTNIRRGKIKTNIAMLIGKYDGMEGFSSHGLYGQEKWKYDKPEQSWNLIKVFYPDSDINAIYYYITKGGNSNVPDKDRKLMEARKGLYRDVVDYKPVGFYTNTPYGVIDVIPVDSKKFSDYKFLFFTGWNTADEKQVKNLCKYVENGGTLLLAKPHLYDTVIRETALSGRAKILESEWVDKLLSYRKTGRVIYFDNDSYPVDYSDEYSTIIRNYAEMYKNDLISSTEYLSFTQYQTEDGTQIYYLLNINWWNDKPAHCDICIGDKKYSLQLKGNDIKVLTAKDNVVVYTDNLYISVEKIENGKVYLNGNGLTNIYILSVNGSRKIQVKIQGKRQINLY